jgi:hypothetical protein
MRGGRAASGIRLAVLVLALGSTLGLQCGGGEQQTWVRLLPDASTVKTFSPLVVEVLVSSPTPIQAFDLGLRWDPAMLSAIHVLPHPDFDDDGAFFANPDWDPAAGRLERVVDLRHGGEGAGGSFRVATVWFMSGDGAGSTSIEPTSRGLSDAYGAEPAPVNLLPITITIEP